MSDNEFKYKIGSRVIVCVEKPKNELERAILDYVGTMEECNGNKLIIKARSGCTQKYNGKKKRVNFYRLEGCIYNLRWPEEFLKQAEGIIKIGKH